MKTLRQLLEKKTDKAEPTAPIEPDSVTSYVPKSKDEKRFMDKHVVQKTDDVNGNGDDVFRGSNIKAYDRSTTRHGYNTKQDQAVYETKQLKTLTQILGEKHLTPAEIKKREEIAQAMERNNPGMNKSKKMAIATAQAKKVAEEVEQIDELSKSTLGSYIKTAAKDAATSRKLAADFKNQSDRAKSSSKKASNTRLSNRFSDITKKRHAGIEKAVERLTKEEAEPINDIFDVFEINVKEHVKAVFEAVDDECKQIIIEMIEAEEFDELMNIVEEVTNG